LTRRQEAFQVGGKMFIRDPKKKGLEMCGLQQKRGKNPNLILRGGAEPDVLRDII